MRRLRLRTHLWLPAFLAVVIAGMLATTVSGSHAEQKWAGQWHFTHLNSPTPGLHGGFALQHRDDAQGADLLELIGGLACPEPTDYFVGAYTVPDSEDLPPDTAFNDTGKFRGCTMGDRLHLRGRYESNSNPETVAGDFELVLLETDNERWNGTFTTEGVQETYTWTGFFQNHFDDGAGDPSIPPYDEPPPPEEPEPPPMPGPQPPGPVASEICDNKQATITPNPGAPAGFAISGTAADDVIVGTDGPDRILGLGGNDTICGFGGDDEIIGAEGNDLVEGGLGNDIVSGDAGEDRLAGDYPDIDLLSPNGGDDQVSGGDDNDFIEGGPGNDKVTGGDGADQLYGSITLKPFAGHPESAVIGSDNDQLLGEGGKDRLFGGRGNDTLDGGGEDDNLYGAGGTDILKGGRGTDRLDGGLGNDRIDGGEGGEHKANDLVGDIAKYFELELQTGVNINLSSGRVFGGQGRDSIRNIESVQGSNRDDVIRGSSGPDILSGGLGDDDIYGHGGDDILYGGVHDDTLVGGAGTDAVYGSSGFDQCSGERRNGCERLIRGAPK